MSAVVIRRFVGPLSERDAWRSPLEGEMIPRAGPSKPGAGRDTASDKMSPG